MSDAEAKKPMPEEELIDISDPEALEQPEDDARIQALEVERRVARQVYARAG